MAVEDHADELRRCFPIRPETAYYVTHYSHRFGYLYVETPKVSCTTIKRVLQLIELDWDEARLPENVHDRTASPLPKLWQEKRPLAEIFQGQAYFRFSFVRNPYTRSLSAYLDKILHNEWERQRLAPQLGLPADGRVSFLDFLAAVRTQDNEDRDIHWRTQHSLLRTDAVPYDFIGRFETFGAGFERVIDRIAPGKGQRALNVRADYHRTDAKSALGRYLGTKERDLVFEIYQDDFKTFSYSADPYFADL